MQASKTLLPDVSVTDGLQVLAPPVSGPRLIDFGRPIGRVTAWLYNLPEVESTHVNLRVPSVSARFATAPVFWNWRARGWAPRLPGGQGGPAVRI